MNEKFHLPYRDIRKMPLVQCRLYICSVHVYSSVTADPDSHGRETSRKIWVH